MKWNCLVNTHYKTIQTTITKKCAQLSGGGGGGGGGGDDNYYKNSYTECWRSDGDVVS
jgi:hypothetical protein